MTRADLLIVGISELATPLGDAARSGADLGRLSILQDAAVACLNGQIVWVGPRGDVDQAVRAEPGTRTLDAAGGTMLPGFVDAHTHLPFAGWREQEFDERLRGATYSEIAARGGGILSTVRHTREASREDLTTTVRARLDRLLRLGTTTVEAKSGYGLEPEAELKQLHALRDAASGHPIDL
ncbi:MAG: imidazolonepropionase, partial [Acidobacteriota bacterium]